MTAPFAVERPRPTEPEEERRGPERPVLWVLLAVVVGAVAWLLAPDPWPTGAGELEVRIPDGPTRVIDVTVGDTSPVEVTAGDLTIELPTGVPVAAPITVRVTGATHAHGDAEVLLRLPDGRDEVVPVLREEDGTAVAERRPPAKAAAVLALLGVVVVLWVSELLPLHVTSMAIPVVLVAVEARTASDALAPFAHPIIALFFGGYLMAEAMRRVGLDRRVAITVVGWSGGGPLRLYATVLALSAFLSMWMSNTAAVAVLIPVALAVTDPLGSRGFQRMVVLGLAYAATIGGTGSLIGTPANPLAATFLEDLTGTRITFASWFLWGLPMVVLLLPVIGTSLWLRERDRPDPSRFAAAHKAAREQLAELGPLSVGERRVLVVFLLVVVAWLTQEWHGLNTGIVAVGGAVLLALLGHVRDHDLARISWPSLLTFGGGLSLGLALTASGVSDAIAAGLANLSTLPSSVAVAAVAAVALLTTTVASNTATAATFVPLGVPLAALLGVDPATLVVTVALASSVDFALVVGTPPTMLAYSTGLFTAREILRTGFLLDVAGVVVLVTVVPLIWRLLGLT